MAGFRKKKYFYPYLDNSLGKKKQNKTMNTHWVFIMAVQSGLR